MAMSNCKECGKAVSTLAKTCPSCGVPKPAKVLKKKTSTKKITTKIKKDKTYVWAHCKSNSCKGFDRMLKIPSSALGKRFCSTCGRYLREAKDTQTRAYNKPIEKKNPISQGIVDFKRGFNTTPEEIDEMNAQTENSSTTQTTSGQKDAFSKLMDGQLDLATAFWGFGVVGTMIVGFICGWLSEAYSKWWLIPYIIFVVMVIDGLWAVARNYKIEQVKKKQSEVWGFLVQAFCVMGGLGLFTLIKDTFF